MILPGAYSGDDVNALIFHPGSSTFRLGYAEDTYPKYFLPSVFGLRSSVKQDLQYSPTELVYGAQYAQCLPGQQGCWSLFLSTRFVINDGAGSSNGRVAQLNCTCASNMPDTLSIDAAASAVRKVLGHSSSKVESAVIHGLDRGYDERKFRKRLRKVVDKEDKVAEIVHMIFNLKAGPKEEVKRSRFSDGNGEIVANNMQATPNNAPAGVSRAEARKAEEIMAKAQRMIEERKKALKLHPAKIAPEQAREFMNESLQRLTRAAELQQSIGAQLPALLSYAFEKQPGEPKPLILDQMGRTVDSDGHTVCLTQRTPTLKANIRAEKAAVLSRSSKESVRVGRERSEEDSAFFDERLKLKPVARNRRQLKFVQPGEYLLLASRMRAKSKLTHLEQEISQAAKKTGISSAVKFAMVAPKISEFTESTVPKIEWWDSVVLPGESYDIPLCTDSFPMVNSLIEHPVQLRAPGEHNDRRCLKVYLTKKEQKKLRRQNRKEMQRERTEKVRLGLEPPPEPKVKISNLMRVLASQAVQDPTKMESHVRQQVAKRLEKHIQTNLQRKLTPAQRIAKRAKKYQDEHVVGTHVAVFRVLDLTDPAKKFKIEMNAKQLNIHGIVVLHKDINIVVVEGGPKQVRFFKRLMMHRIKWQDPDMPGKEKSDAPANKCYLIWEGIVKKRAFGELKVKICSIEKMARELFQKHGVEQYWDMAFSTAIMGEERVG
uniref:U4/U6 small nuclear ribonucleoprotein Prp3 n=1 Tax=Trichuris muris TaxID=70415 RepID=A0A5S6Q7T4_TRIMR